MEEPRQPTNHGDTMTDPLGRFTEHQSNPSLVCASPLRINAVPVRIHLTIEPSVEERVKGLHMLSYRSMRTLSTRLNERGGVQ